MMKDRLSLRKIVICSCFLHGVAIVFALMSSSPPTQQVAVPSVEVQLLSQSRPAQPTAEARRLGVVRRRPFHRGISKPTLRDFLPERSTVSASSTSDAALASHAGWGDDRIFLDFESFLGRNDNWEFYRAIYTNIDSRLMFDSLLAQYNHFGIVDIRFAVNADGTLDKSFAIATKTADSVLKVHVLRAIRNGTLHALPLARNFKGAGPITFIARFQFLKEDPALNWEKQRAFGKPVFVFSRATLEKPIPTTLADHLLNGGIDYDLFAAAERWQKFNEKKRRGREAFDPFYDYRADPDYRL